jgi:hypothetical protein
MQAVINKSDSWLKKVLTSDPGTLEQIQQRVADALNSIEAPPEYDDPILDSLSLSGFELGFENGKFEVKAKLFAIDAFAVPIRPYSSRDPTVAIELAPGLSLRHYDPLLARQVFLVLVQTRNPQRIAIFRCNGCTHLR